MLRYMTIAIFVIAITQIAQISKAAYPETSVSMMVPGQYEIVITEVYDVSDEIWVIVGVRNNRNLSSDKILSNDSIMIQRDKKPVKNFMVGKSWTWDDNRINNNGDGQYTFLSDRRWLDAELPNRRAKLLYKRPPHILSASIPVASSR